MISKIMLFLFFCYFYSIIFCKNPMEMSVKLVGISAACSLFIFLMFNIFFFPFLIFSLFVGGILMMFMLVSSLFPNEKFFYPSSILFFSSITSLTYLFFFLNETFKSLQFFNTVILSLNYFFLIFIMLIYFFSFLELVNNNKMTLRYLMCLKYKAFVMLLN